MPITGDAVGNLDARFLKLDASNDPITSNLEITGNLIFTQGASRFILIAQSTGTGNTLYISAGNAVSVGTSKGGDLYLNAGQGSSFVTGGAGGDTYIGGGYGWGGTASGNLYLGYIAGVALGDVYIKTFSGLLKGTSGLVSAVTEADYLNTNNTLASVMANGATTGLQLTSTLAIGTSPFAVTSTTVNTNLNADLWDDYDFDDYLDQAVKTTSTPTFADLTLLSTGIKLTPDTGLINLAGIGNTNNESLVIDFESVANQIAVHTGVTGVNNLLITGSGSTTISTTGITITMTGTGTKRTCTADSSIFKIGSVGQVITTTGLTNALILNYTSTTVVTILVPSGYSNESGVSFTLSLGKTLGIDFDANSLGPTIFGSRGNDTTERLFWRGDLIAANNQYMIWGNNVPFALRCNTTNNDFLEFHIRTHQIGSSSGIFVLTDPNNQPSWNLPNYANPTFRLQAPTTTQANYLQTWHNGAHGFIDVGTGNAIVANSQSLDVEKLNNTGLTGSPSTYWTIGTGWAWSPAEPNATAVVKSSAASSGTLSQPIANMVSAPVVGEVYLITYTISSLTAGGVTPSFAGVTMLAASANGTYTEIIVATNATGALTFTPTSDATALTMDNISVKKIIGGNIRALGDYYSADNSVGYTGTIDASVTPNIVVKNGLVISAS